MTDRILIADALEESGRRLLAEGGAQVDVLSKDDRPRLLEIIADYDALVVRSATKVTAELLRAGKRLRVVGRAGVGVDNIDVAAATEQGVLVVNSPTANLMSATEHTFALLLAVTRQVTHADAEMKQGVWNRKHVGAELWGKTLGVIGFGQIGQRVARRARAFEMTVLAYDPFIDRRVAESLDVEPVAELAEMLPRVDMLTFHTPLTPATRGMLGANELALMKAGSFVVNCGRGGVLDEDALLGALESGHLGGAGLDVFAQEPPTSFALAQHPKVVATPHIGAQTAEAQERVADEIARMVVQALRGSLNVAAVNLPFRSAGSRGEPYLLLAETLGRLASGLLQTYKEAPLRLEIQTQGVDESLLSPLQVAALKGVLVGSLREAVNYVNAEQIARSRGIETVRSLSNRETGHAQLVTLRLHGANKSVELAGTLASGDEPRVVALQGYRLEFRPQGILLVLHNDDRPGVVGSVGTTLGKQGVNIADIHLSRNRAGGHALAVLRVDETLTEASLAALRELPEILSIGVIDLG